MTYYHHHRDKDPTERMFERLSKNPDVEEGLHRLENNPTTDPALRDMARAVLEECEHGRQRRENRKIGNVIGGIAVIVFLIIMFIFAMARNNKNHY